MLPNNIKLNGPDGTVVVEWADGHRSAYPYPYLRRRCPCATCSGAPGKAAVPSNANTLPIFGTQALKPGRAELVGRYALQIFWSDGHSSGIYTFDYLRGLCPCGQCANRGIADE